MAALTQVGLALILLVVSTTKGAEQCRTGCQGVTPDTFKYAEGTTYKYDYDGSVEFSLCSAKGQHSTTKVKATVLLTQQAQCNQILRVQNIQIVGGDSKRYTNIANIEKPIVLNFHDGHTEDVICTDPSDTQNSLNVKRAIASLFQAAQRHHGTEVDVFGSCPTEFSTSKEGQFNVIRKTRNLNKCSHRESLRQDFMTTAFDLHSEIKTSPLLQGEYAAELKIKAGIPQTITVTENYLYVPFSNEEKGARAKVVSQLRYAGVSRENPSVHCNVPKSIIFENPHPITTDKSSVGTILKTIKETANAIDVNVKENSASKFASIIKLMRGAPTKDLIAIYGQVRAGAGFTNKEVGRRVFLDSLFRVRTGEAIEVAIDIYKSNGLNDVESKLFFASLNFVQHVTEGALSSAANLLSHPNLPREAYLGIGVLVNRYCRQHTCTNVKSLNAVLSALQSKLTNRPGNREAENIVLAALKAITNAKKVTNPLVGKIIEIAQDKQSPTRLRAAALEAYLSDPCNDRFRDSGVNILKDIQQDSEIRIKAYLAITQCPNGKVANAIKSLLENEPSVQVGGYIVSHLATLKSSVNPDKALAKAQLGEIRTTKKFAADFRQYSFNAEFSHSFESLGVGDSFEGDVIYSQKSFLPRSTSLNLTTDIFGHRYNFLEIETRQENLDALVATFVGPNGLLRTQSPHSLFKQGSTRLQELIYKIRDGLLKTKQKREINKNQIETFAKQLVDRQNTLNKDLDLDLSVKLFGSELFFLSLNEDIKKYTPETIVEKLLDCVDKFKEKAKNFDETLTSNVLFLDSAVTYPTSTGFPLRLSVEGASSVQVKTSGKLDIDGLIKGAGEFSLSFIPSVSVEIASRFVVDAGVVESGLNVVGNLYSSVGASAELTLKNNAIDYKVKLPLDKQEILSVTHNIVFETRELCGPETKVPLKFVQNRDFTVCFDQLQPFVGLTFCAVLNQPNVGEESANVLPFPLNGNSKVSLNLKNVDFGYFLYQLVNEHDGPAISLEVFDKSNARKSAFKYRMKLFPDPMLAVEFISPITNANFEARVVNTNTNLYGMVRFTISPPEEEYYLKLGVAISGSDSRTIYRPIMEYKAGASGAQKLPYRVEGQIVSQKFNDYHKKYVFDNVQLICPDGKPITITGNVVRERSEYSSDLTLNDGVHHGTFKGKLHLIDQGFNCNAQLVNNFNPDANFDLKYSLKGKDFLNLASNLQIIHGPDISNKNALFKLSNSIAYADKGDDTSFETEHEVSYPGLGIDNKFKLKSSKKILDLELRVGYKKVKVGTELEVEVDKRSRGDLDFEWELYGFDNTFEVEITRQVNGYKSKILTKFTLNGNCLEIQGDVKHLIEQQRGDIGHDLIIKITSRPDIKWKSELKYSQHDLDTSIKIQSGQELWLDAFLKANQAGNANGNLKLNIPGRVTANGQVKANKGAGNAYLLVNFIEIKRKVKNDVTFTIHQPTYNLDWTLYTNFEKDNSRKYHLVTNNQIKPESLIDSKNTLDILGSKTTVNVKLSNVGDINDLEQVGELELVLPTEQYFAAKGNRKLKSDKGVFNGQGFLTLEERPNKNAAGRTLTLKGTGKDIDLNRGIFDMTYNLALEEGAGKNLLGDLTLKKYKSGDEDCLDYNGKLYGSSLPHELEAAVHLKTKSSSGNYKISTNYGNSATLNVKGKYDFQQPESKRPSTGDVFIDILTPNSVIRVIKFNIQGSLLQPNTDADSLEVKGSTAFFVDDDGSQKGSTLDIKYETDVKIGATRGHFKDKLTAQKLDPISIGVEYFYEPDKKYEGEVAVHYGKDKTVKGTVEIAVPDENTLDFDLQFETPVDKAKKVRWHGHAFQKDNEHFKSEYTLTINELKYLGKIDLDLEETRPGFNVELTYPTGKVDRIYEKMLRYDDNGVATEGKIVLHTYEFTLDYNLDVTVRSPEDFNVKMLIDSPKININKVSLTAHTKEAHGNKKLAVNILNNGKTVVDGVTTYKIRKEEGKVIIDGSGTLTVNNEKKSGNFKILYKELSERRDKETGIELTISSIIGSKAFDIEYILTTDHFKYLTSYCVEKKECAHIEVERKSQKDDVEILQINLDLRPLGVSHEFGLKAETLPKQLKHSLDVHLVRDQYRYQYNALILRTQSHFTLTTPKRVVSLEIDVNSPKGIEPLKGKACLYLNKKAKPQEKTQLDFQLSRDKVNEGSFDLKLTAPPLKKPLVVSCKISDLGDKKLTFDILVDILPNTDKKILITSVSSIVKEGEILRTTSKTVLDLQPLHYKIVEDESIVDDLKNYDFSGDYKVLSIYKNKPIESSYKWKYCKDTSYAKLTLYNKVIFDINARAKISKEYSVVDTDYKFIGSSPSSSHLEIKDGNTIKFSLYRTGQPNKKFQVNTGFIPGSIADFRMDIHSENQKIDLVHGSIKLDEHDFGKSDYGVDSKNIDKYLIKTVHQASNDVVQASTDVLTEAVGESKTSWKTFGDEFQANQFDYGVLVNYYEAEMKILREELITDKSLKQLSESVGNVISAVVTVTMDFFKTVQKITSETIAAIHAQTLNLADLLEKQILPQCKTVATAIAEKVVGIFESVTDLVVGILSQVTSFMDAHQNELQQVATALSEVTKDIIRFVQKVNAQVSEILEMEFVRIAQEFQALAITEDIENYIKNLSAGKPTTEESIAKFKEHVAEFKSKITHPKSRDLIDVTAAYIEKKMRDQECDDTEEITKIIRAALDAIQELVEAVAIVDFSELDITDIPIPSKILDTLPNFVLSKCSLLTRLIDGDIPRLSQLSSFATLNPKQIIVPLKKYAIVAQGQHIFTFDGKHLTFPGKCSYLLSRDVVNDEFSIVGTYVNGALSELTFVDKAETITLKKNGAVTYNGAATEFPVRGKNTDAFRTYDQIHLKSNNGVTIYCLPDLTLVAFSISGFYHGQLRGLLGNANGEPYDDYTLPKGNIVTSESDFGNAYKMQGNCPAVKTVDHHTHHHAESCTKLFTEISELSPCFLFVNPSNFRQACDHGVAANVPHTEQAIGRAYALACASRFIPAPVPSEYVTCDNSDKTYNVFETFSVKLPAKAADVVFAIDADKRNTEVYKDLIAGLGNTLLKDLSERGIKDVEFHVLTYGGEHPDYPSHITTNGGKMTFKGRMPQLKFGESPDEDDLDFGHEGVNFIVSLLKNYLDELNLALGFEPQSQAYLEAINYPFRAHAVKAIVAVSSAPCQKSEFILLQKLRAMLLRQPTINLNLITPLAQECNFKVKDEKTTKNVIGFSNKGVFTYSDAKKKPTGNPDLLKELSYDDFCSEFTALSGGNVFVLDNYAKNKKQFTSITSYNIAESLTSHEQGLDCACIYDGLLTGKNRCRLVYSKEKPHAPRKLLRG